MCQKAAVIKEGKIIKNETVKTLVQMLEFEDYVITVKKITDLNVLKNFHLKTIDEHTLEVRLEREEELNNFLLKLSESGMVMTDIRTKGFRLEKLFLNILQG